MQESMPDRNQLKDLLPFEIYDAFFNSYDQIKEIVETPGAEDELPPLVRQLPNIIYSKFATAVLFLAEEKIPVGSEAFFDLLGQPWHRYLIALNAVLQQPDSFMPQFTTDPDCMANWRRIGACYTVRAACCLIRDIKLLCQCEPVEVELCIRLCSDMTMLYVTALTLKLPEVERQAVRAHLGKGARKLGRTRQEGMEIVARLAAELLEKNRFLRFTSKKKFGQINRSSLAYAIVDHLKEMARAGAIRIDGPPEAFDLDPQTIADEYLRPLIERGVVK